MAERTLTESGADLRWPRPRVRPLAGIRVADFSWVVVGGLSTRLLADFGAEVIKIEDRNRLDLTRRMPIYPGQRARGPGEEDASPDPDLSGLFNNINRNKLSVTIDLRKEEGRELARDLIRRSDVVTENFAPGVMERWSLDGPAVVSLRPDVIYARMSGYGHSGLHQFFRSYGPIVQAVSGLTFLGGLPDREPSGWGFSYMDLQGAYFGTIAILSAIAARLRTQRGTEIDIACIEAAINLLGPVLLDVAANGRPARGNGFPPGNALEYSDAAPHGVYPSRGEDRWIALTVFSDEEWEGLVAEAGSGPLADSQFATSAGRCRARALLDQRLGDWTRSEDAYDLMHRLQARGVRAAAVANSQDLFERDEQLAHRAPWFQMSHPVIGPATFEDFPVGASALRPDHWRSAPCLGEDNEYVLRSVLGMDEDRYNRYAEAGII